MIQRHTRGGLLRLTDVAPILECGTCSGEKTAAGEPPLGLHVELAQGAHDGRTLDTGICADCLAEALAILFGRRHVQQGGRISDLAFDRAQLGVCPHCGKGDHVENPDADRYVCAGPGGCGAAWRGARLGTPE